jgi:hypothetical protein
MRRFASLAVSTLLSLAVLTLAGEPKTCLHCQSRCYTPPPPRCPDCSGPCEKRCCLTLCGPEHAAELLEALHNPNFCIRLKAARKLGCRLHADFCQQPDVLEGLIGALQCDTCWDVRYAAAWSIFRQNARVPAGILALYVSSRLDPHYLVRLRASEALDILTLGRKECYKELLKAGDKLITELRSKKYKPGTSNCRVLFGAACAHCGLNLALPFTPRIDQRHGTARTRSPCRGSPRRAHRAVVPDESEA